MLLCVTGPGYRDVCDAVFRLPRLVGTHLPMPRKASLERRRDRRMCYTRRDYSLEEEARKLRMEEESRRRREEEAQHPKEKQEKPLTEKVKEMVGVR